jgi:hypothetical protein
MSGRGDKVRKVKGHRYLPSPVTGRRMDTGKKNSGGSATDGTTTGGSIGRLEQSLTNKNKRDGEGK